MNHLLIDSVFNYINFAFRVGVVIYLIKKYVAPTISSSILYEKESAKLIEQQQLELKNQCMEIEKQIKDQEQLYFDLQNKFAIWQSALLRIDQEHECLVKEHEQKMIYQLEKKELHAARAQFIKNELPIILKNVEKDLESKIKQDPRLGKKYIQDLLDFTAGK